MSEQMKDKVCVITGGTDGIGKAAAHALALQGAKLLIHGRDRSRKLAAGRRRIRWLLF
jgi:NAD(P)-dependent dehydrogenase (short-subunit alcohol dehydrogenase family)